MFVLNSLGIDTISFLLPFKSVIKILNDNGYVIEDYSKNHIINQYFKDKEIKDDDYDIKFVKISNVKNISGYMILKFNKKSITSSKKMKKGKYHFVEVVFAGLRQPTKDIHINTYKALNLFKNKKIATMDICIDGFNDLTISKDTDDKHKYIFSDYFVNDEDIKTFMSSFYINNVSNPNDNADDFDRALVYDKYIKETQRGKKLDDSLKNWKRVEVTVRIGTDIQDKSIDDYILDVLSFADNYFDNLNNFNLDYLENQIGYICDKRKHKGISII